MGAVWKGGGSGGILQEGGEGEEGEELGEWKKGSKSVNAAAREVCGVVRGKITQPWMVGREKEVSWFSEEIRMAVQEMDSFLEIIVWLGIDLDLGGKIGGWMRWIGN